MILPWRQTQTKVIRQIVSWCGREDLNLHSRVHPPQACASASSATTAYVKLVPTSSHTYLKLMRLQSPHGLYTISKSRLQSGRSMLVISNTFSLPNLGHGRLCVGQEGK